MEGELRISALINLLRVSYCIESPMDERTSFISLEQRKTKENN